MPQSRRLRLAILLAAGALLLAQWVATALLVGRAREAAIGAASDTVQRVARAVEASLNRSFVQVDAVLAGLPAFLAPLATREKLDLPLMTRVLRELNNQNFTFRDILLLDEGGRALASGLPISRRRRLPFTPEAAPAVGGSAQAAVQIHGPHRNPATGEWALYMVRRVMLPEFGTLLAVAEMPVPVVGTLLSAGGTGAGMRITLERDDGMLLASQPHDETRIGTRLQPSIIARRGQEAAPGQALRANSRFDRDPVIAAVRPLLYPTLLLSASMKESAALADWQQERLRAVIVSAALAALVAALAAALILALRQRERVEAERASWRQRLENALDSMTDGFVMWDANDRLIACNARYRDLYKVSAPFIHVGAHFDDIMREGYLRGQYPQHSGDVEVFLDEMRRWHRGNHPPRERLLPDGRWVLITERATPGGGSVGIRTEITGIKRAMEDLAAARDAAAAAGEAKSQFLARMSHELRTPLNGVLGFAQVLLNDARLEPDQREHVRTLHEAARHLLELVNGLLDLSKIAAGKLELQPEPMELKPLLERGAALLAPEVSRKAQHFELSLAPGTPQVVLADATRLRQLLLNLLGNAVKFTPPGGTVTLRALPLAGREGIRLEVIDTGPGIPAEKRHLLFQDFVQLAVPAAGSPDSTSGTGLGLSIAAQLAGLMGGSIGCESEPGHGATFWVELPLPSASMPPRSVEAPAEPAEGGAVPALRVLVVDDVPANRLVARAMLTSAGHHVTCVEDGAVALAAVQHETYDLVLMDLQMPVMDGLEATRRIRALDLPCASVPIVAVTASAMPEQVSACRAAGMDGHLAKPIDRDMLLRLVARFARARAAGRARQPEAEPEPAPPRDGRAELLDAAAGEALAGHLGQAAPAVLGEFLAELEQSRRTLEALAARPDTVQLRAATHRLLGVARTLGARQLSEALEALQATGTPEALAEARAALDRTLPAVRQWLERQKARA